MLRVNLQDYSDAEGNLDQYAWPGGYPIVWVEDSSGDWLCSDCATKVWRDRDRPATDLFPQVEETGYSYTCDDCGKEVF